MRKGGDEGTTEVDRARGRLSSGMSSWIKEERAMNTCSSKIVNRPTPARVTTGYLYPVVREGGWAGGRGDNRKQMGNIKRSRERKTPEGRYGLIG